MAINLNNEITSAVNNGISTVSENIDSAVQSVNTQVANSILNEGLEDIGSDLLDGVVDDLLGNIDLGNLIDNAEELIGLASNPLKIVERGIADISGLTGEDFGLTLEQYRELSERSAYTEFAGRGDRLPYDGDDTSASRIPNPLRNHNGFNYKITLGILDADEYNNPESYRSSGGFKNYIIQSSGGNLNKRYQVFDETGGGQSDHAEYYIDDIELDAVVAPNPNTRITSGTSLSFTVVEPYSMGNFIQAVIGSANEAGYSGYTQAPFCLKIDFVGWNLDGSTNANFLDRPIFVPIQIINMDFNVSGSGSKYEVKAVPMSETGLSDNINKIKTPIKATGLKCHEVLETNDLSVTGAINRHIEGLEETGALAPYDRYIIAFPKNRDTLMNSFKEGKIVDTAFTTSPEEREEQRRATGVTNPALRSSFNPTVVTIDQSTQVYSILKSFAENTDLMNEIGLSFLNEDTNAPGNSSEADALAVINPETKIVDIQNVAAQPSDKARDFQFGQNQQITSIIEKIVLQTTYAAERATEGATNGLNKWFKIDTQVFIEEGQLTESQLGRRPKVYVYSVVPYEVDEAVTASGNSKSKNTQGLRDAAAKEYNYIYTGKNEDVLNFDINFNNAFMLTAYADLGMTSAPIRDTDAGTAATTQSSKVRGATMPATSNAQSNDDPGPVTELDTMLSLTAGARSNDIRIKVAEMFHDRITNMTVDMVTAEMEIMGDPYFIPQETGNYVAQRSSKPSITQDGTMTYQQGPVYCIVNFKTPFDYQIQGATMEFPQIVPGFSGIFQVWAVVNRFSGGKFTQTLKMIRRRGQDDPSTDGNSNFIQLDDSVAQAPITTQSDGTVGETAPPSDDVMSISGLDDIRNLMPTLDNAAIAQLTEPFSALEDQLAEQITPFAEQIAGIDFGIADIPDLTKVIPTFADDFQSQIDIASNGINSAVNSVAEQGISSITNLAESKAKGLLG